MKLIIIFLSIILILHSVESRHTIRTHRSINLQGWFSNKTSSITNYVIAKEQALEDLTIGAVNKRILPVTAYFSDMTKKTKDTIVHTVGNRTAKIMKTFQSYVDKVENTVSTMYKSIAPAQDDYKCYKEETINIMTAQELITLHGYFVETHTVITEDGYLLTLHRIPFSRINSTKEGPQKTVLLHHGLLGSSIDWVIPGPKNSLAYIMSDAGYDVWMANIRGNTYSKAHVFRNVDTYAFWNFTFHEVGYYDLPAVIDYIIEKKGRDVKVYYVGFSMGTTALFTLLSTKPQYNDILTAGFALAPVAYLSHIKSLFRHVARVGNSIESLLKHVGAYEFLPRNSLVRYLSKHSCKVTNYQEALCKKSMFLLCPHNKEHFDRSLIPLILGHVPAGASTKTLAHFAQEIRSGKFQYFDYGSDGNMKEYGTVTPPEYPVNKITLPIALISAKDDWLSSVIDAKSLYSQLINPIEHYIVPDEKFDHLDFVFAHDAPFLVYDKLLLMMENLDLQTDYDNKIL